MYRIAPPQVCNCLQAKNKEGSRLNLKRRNLSQQTKSGLGHKVWPNLKILNEQKETAATQSDFYFLPPFSFFPFLPEINELQMSGWMLRPLLKAKKRRRQRRRRGQAVVARLHAGYTEVKLILMSMFREDNLMFCVLCFRICTPSLFSPSPLCGAVFKT